MSDNVPDTGAQGEGDAEGVRQHPGSSAESTIVPDDISSIGDLDSNRVAELESLVTERTADLQRLQAEYVNYKKRVDRDRDLARGAGAEKVLAELLPTLDAVALAEEHGELTGGFKLVADQLEKVAAKHGLVAFGTIGDEFDPHHHEALMHLQLPGATTTCVSQVMQRGYQLNDRVLRPARVAVSDPDPDAEAASGSTQN